MKAEHLSEPVLVVDDDPDGRDMLVQYLQFNGFNVHEASNGAAALAVASTLRPRVILMDLEMGGLDGLETTRRMRANVSTKQAIIVAVTGRVFATDRNEAHRAGFDDFISKPFDITTLPDYLDRLLGTAGRVPMFYYRPLDGASGTLKRLGAGAGSRTSRERDPAGPGLERSGQVLGRPSVFENGSRSPAGAATSKQPSGDTRAGRRQCPQTEP